MQRLAALVPGPWLHLIRFHGVLAANAKLCATAVPLGPVEGAEAAKPAECEAKCAHHCPARPSWAPLLKRDFDLELEHCPDCGGELKIIGSSGFLERQPAIAVGGLKPFMLAHGACSKPASRVMAMQAALALAGASPSRGT